MGGSCSVDGGCVDFSSERAKAMGKRDKAAGHRSESVESHEQHVNERLENIREGHSTMGSGSQGLAVRSVQRALNIIAGNKELTLDGDFGPKTENAIKAFQKDHNITPNGKLNRETLAAIDSQLTAKGKGDKLCYSSDDEPICVPSASKSASDRLLIPDAVHSSVAAPAVTVPAPPPPSSEKPAAPGANATGSESKFPAAKSSPIPLFESSAGVATTVLTNERTSTSVDGKLPADTGPKLGAEEEVPVLRRAPNYILFPDKYSKPEAETASIVKP